MQQKAAEGHRLPGQGGSAASRDGNGSIPTAPAKYRVRRDGGG
jgi:hypothetical protein